MQVNEDWVVAQGYVQIRWAATGSDLAVNGPSKDKIYI